jgi:hypothetical protein
MSIRIGIEESSMEADNLDSIRASRDAEWLARQPRLDQALTAAIRAPAVHARFDEQVWALVRADEAEALAMRATLGTRLRTPWWLYALNFIAIAVTAVAVALALRSVVVKNFAATAGASTFVEHSMHSPGFLMLVVGAGLWFFFRQTSAGRVLTRTWL